MTTAWDFHEDIRKQAANVSKAAEAVVTEAAAKVVDAPETKTFLTDIEKEAHAVASAVEEHVKGLEGHLVGVLTEWAKRVRAGEMTVTEQAKAELKKMGVKI